MASSSVIETQLLKQGSPSYLQQTTTMAWHILTGSGTHPIICMTNVTRRHSIDGSSSRTRSGTTAKNEARAQRQRNLPLMIILDPGGGV